jgi:hypothetical protein
MAITLELATCDVACNATVDLVDSGSGTAHLDIRDSTDTLLVSIALPNPAFHAAFGGVATAFVLPIGGYASAAGTMATYEMVNRNGDILWTGTIGTAGSGANMIVDATAIALGQGIVINTWSHTVPQ